MKNLFLMVLLFLLIISTGNVSAQTEEKRLARLSDLAKVWGAVKFFHPYPAYREIDWDKSLIDAIPKVDQAKSAEEYAAAVNGMLAALGDKETTARVESLEINQPPRAIANQSPARLENGILLYDLPAASRVTFKEYQKLNEFAAAVEKLLPQAKAVVIDARGLSETNDEVLAEFGYEMTNILPLMLDQNITLGTIRYRMHNGYAAQAGESSGDYYSSFVTDMPQPFSGNSKTKTPPLIFLVDERNGIAPILSGLQTAKKAFVIADGATSTGGDFYTMKLGENVEVKIRKTETVNPDGSIGFAPDLIVPKGDSLKTAKKLIAENKFISNRARQTAIQIGLVSQKDKPYAEMEFPSKEYRLLALFRFWNVINYFFAYKDLIGADWNTILPKYIPQFEADKDAPAYRITAQKMVAEIHDSHGFFDAPLLKDAPPVYLPPFIEDFAENKLFIKTVLDEKSGFRTGDVITEVDNAPVESLIDEYASRIAASTPQALMRDVKNKGIFRGAKDSGIRFKVVGLDGISREIETTRSISSSDPRQYQYRFVKRVTPAVSVLPSGFGYIDLDRLAASDNDIDQAFETIKSTPAAIFDLRGYPRGDDSRIIAHLTDKPIAPTLFTNPYIAAKSLGDPSASGGSIYGVLQLDRRADNFKGALYRGKIIVLIDEHTQSAAEGTAGFFARARPETIYIGTPTAGANGDVTYLVLPGNIKIGFSGHNVRRYDGEQLQRVGIQPTVNIAPTIRGIVKGQDEILDAAISFLKSNQ